MLVSAPWRAFGLKVTFFSDTARQWWEEELEENSYLRRTPTGRIKKDILDHRVTRQELKGVDIVLRREGVDGDRLSREHGSTVQGIGPIPVDDGQLSLCVC
jgi:hypothetical protein